MGVAENVHIQYAYATQNDQINFKKNQFVFRNF